MTHPLKGEGILLVPKGNPDDIEVNAVYEGRTPASGPKAAIGIKISGLWATLALGIAVGYLFARFIG